MAFFKLPEGTTRAYIEGSWYETNENGIIEAPDEVATTILSNIPGAIRTATPDLVQFQDEAEVEQVEETGTRVGLEGKDAASGPGSTTGTEINQAMTQDKQL
jgi:hypothetical protein